MGKYTYILEESLRLLAHLPAIIPKKGAIAGFSDEFAFIRTAFTERDNRHYPMGTSYLTYGIPGVAEKARKSISENKTDLQNELLECIGRVYDAVGTYLLSYLPVIDELLLTADTVEASRLTEMRHNLEAAATRAPQSFSEALQLYYIMWRIRCITGCSCIGRTDQHLGRFLDADLDSGKLTESRAIELLCDMWELCNRCGSGDTLMNIMVGGKNANGTDASNRLSRLILESCIKTKKTEPHVNVRWHKNISPKVMDAAYRLQYLGFGQASVYNDELIIPSLIRHGYPSNAAHSYTNDGCTEIMLDGYSRIDFNHIDVMAVLELTLWNGRYVDKSDYESQIRYFHRNNRPRIYTPDAEIGFAGGEVDGIETFQELFELFIKQYEFQLRNRMLKLYDLNRRLMLEGVSSIFLNGSFSQILESGVDLTRKGLGENCYMVFSGSIPTVADALYALKVKVFDEKKYTLAQIKAALKCNYEGHEALRRELLAVDKFGNDIDGPDLLAAEIAKRVSGFMWKYSDELGLRILPAYLGWKFLEEAYGTVASADGRKYGDPIAEHYCATPGRAASGPTAIINSVAKTDLSGGIGVAPVHISLPRNFASDEENGIKLLKALNDAAMIKGLMMLNIGIYDAKRLREAQRDPENNRDLIVRVWGYCARFVDLCEEMQNHIISRIL